MSELTPEQEALADKVVMGLQKDVLALVTAEGPLYSTLRREVVAEGKAGAIIDVMAGMFKSVTFVIDGMTDAERGTYLQFLALKVSEMEMNNE